MYLAMYKGPANGFWNQLSHCAIRVLTFSRYSHVELVIRGTCWSSSPRDGGVRGKQIDLATGRWDIFPLEGNEERAYAWFQAHKGEGYDWAGMLRCCPLLRWLPKRQHKKFCSEAVACALAAHPDPETLHPQAVLDFHCPL